MGSLNRLPSTVLICLFSSLPIATNLAASAGEGDARAHHKRGVELFKAGDFDNAAEEFRRAYELKPTWKLQFNIGQCEATSKRYGLALEAFEAYLVGGGDDVPEERRETVASEVRRLQPLVGVIDINGAPVGSKVYVDGIHRGTVPLKGLLRVAAGPHEILVGKDEAPLYDDRISVASGMTTTLDVGNSADIPPTAAPAENETISHEDEIEPETATLTASHSWKWTAGWIGIGTGVAAAAAGAITGLAAMSKRNEYEDLCPDGACLASDLDEGESLNDSKQTLAVTTNVLLPTGAVLAGIGAILLILEARSPDSEGRTELSLVPAVDDRSAGLFIHGSF